jgi:hypothetical protein
VLGVAQRGRVQRESARGHGGGRKEGTGVLVEER